MDWKIKSFHEIRGGQKTITNIEFSELSKKVNKKDTLNLTGYIVNGYNGFSSAKLILGFYRVVCKNGMTIDTKELQIGYRHVGNVNEKLIEQFKMYIENKVKKATILITAMINHRFKNIKQIESVIDKSDWLGEKYKSQIYNAYKAEKLAQKLTFWRLFNAYTYVITHNMKINQESRLNYYRHLNTESKEWETRF